MILRIEDMVLRRIDYSRLPSLRRFCESNVNSYASGPAKSSATSAYNVNCGKSRSGRPYARRRSTSPLELVHRLKLVDKFLFTAPCSQCPRKGSTNNKPSSLWLCHGLSHHDPASVQSEKRKVSPTVP